MKALGCGVVFLVLVVSASAQNPQSGSGMPGASQSQPERVLPAAAPQGKANADQLQRNAEELMTLTQSIPTDIDALNRGLLPKDMVDKLKRIEKLSKQLRKQLPH